MIQQNNNHLVDINTYLSKNKRFKSFIYDHRKIRNIADNLGCKTDHVRTELRKLGYSLTKNSNGRLVWKRDHLTPNFPDDCRHLAQR
jgi:hypothetical protein